LPLQSQPVILYFWKCLVLCRNHLHIIKQTLKLNKCNCGKQREEHHSQSPAGSNKNTVSSKNKIWDDVYFEYTGQSELSVTGKITRRQYRFSGPGDLQAVDYRDASALMAIPAVKKTAKK